MSLDLSQIVLDYGDVDGEVRACRDHCALFDFSFMARGRLTGAGAIDTIHKLQPRTMHGLQGGKIRYGLRLDTDGQVVSDLTVWRFPDNSFEVMSGRHVDIADLSTLATENTHVEDLTATSVVFAVQGPRSFAKLRPLVDNAERLASLAYFSHDRFNIGTITCQIGRLGYTGERGFELVADLKDRDPLWHALSRDIAPAGFAAANVLRIEAGFVLFANECRVKPTPMELGLEAFVSRASRHKRMSLVCFEADVEHQPQLWHPSGAMLQPPKVGQIVVTSAYVSTVSGAVLGLGFVPAGDPSDQYRDPYGQFHNITLTSLPLRS